MLGPVFNREALVVPKRPATYLARGLYVGTLFLLLCTGYLVLGRFPGRWSPMAIPRDLVVGFFVCSRRFS